MKKVYTMFAVGALLAGLIGTAAAQGAGPKGGQGNVRPGVGQRQQGQGQRGPGGRMGEMQKQILAKIQPPLSADQKKKVEALNKKFAEELRKAFQGGGQGGDREARRAKFQAMRKKHTDEIKKILNAKQFASYEKLMKEARERGRQGGPGGPGGPPPGAGRGGGVRPPA